MALGKVFLRELRFSPFSIIPSTLQSHLHLSTTLHNRHTTYLTNLSLPMQAKTMHKDCHLIQEIKVYWCNFVKVGKVVQITQRSWNTCTSRDRRSCTHWQQLDANVIVSLSILDHLQQETVCLWGRCVIVDTVYHLRNFHTVFWKLTFFPEIRHNCSNSGTLLGNNQPQSMNQMNWNI